MEKILFVDPEKCTGCRICETVCSIGHEKVANPSRARIHIVKWETIGLYVPMVCQQCESPLCEAVCPVDAPKRDPKTGAMLVDYDVCVGCRMCMIACPLGGVGFDKKAKKVIKCDLCDGDPKCVEFCEPKALQYVEATTATLVRKRGAAQRLSELMKKLGA